MAVATTQISAPATMASATVPLPAVPVASAMAGLPWMATAASSEPARPARMCTNATQRLRLSISTKPNVSAAPMKPARE